MHYSKKNNIAFLHFPKTAGISLSAWFQNTFPDSMKIVCPRIHEPLQIKFDRDRIFPEMRTANIFAVIRNPYKMVTSLHAFMRDSLKAGHAGRFFDPELVRAAHESDFSEWLRLIDEKFYSYWDFFNVDGKIPDNLTILKMEDLKTEFPKYIKSVIGDHVSTEIPHENKGKYRASVTLTPIDIELIQRKYAWCFDQGYYDRDSYKELFPAKPTLPGLPGSGIAATANP